MKLRELIESSQLPKMAEACKKTGGMWWAGQSIIGMAI